MFENGVKYYTNASCAISVPFPEHMTICQWCMFCRSEESLKRHRCLLTNEYLVHPFTCRGNKCPLKFENNNDERE